MCDVPHTPSSTASAARTTHAGSPRLKRGCGDTGWHIQSRQRPEINGTVTKSIVERQRGTISRCADCIADPLVPHAIRKRETVGPDAGGAMKDTSAVDKFPLEIRRIKRCETAMGGRVHANIQPAAGMCTNRGPIRSDTSARSGARRVGEFSACW